MTTTTAISLADPALSARLTERLALVEERLRDAVTHADQLADDAARHLVNAGGKRLRPLLTLLTAELGDGSRREVVDAATVVELTHLATLYHDDVMDSAPLRRGAPSAHEVWGNSVAILTGDLLFARASATVAGLGPDAVRIQAATFERLCLGQLHETVGPRPGEDPVAHYLQVLADKTASLVATSARFGAMFAGCRPDVVRTVTGFGEKLGVAFQLADDVIDLTSDGTLTGKTPGTDLRERVPTMPALLLRARAATDADPADRALVAQLDADLTDDDALAAAVAALRSHPVVAETRERAVALAREAVDELAPLPAGPVREALVAFADALVDRAS
ncbi:polyprenyl synthetase family protein [Cellulomonas fimi]|uniref:Polyprenyl synthetase n=1 Tax=Cellulomonas fimi (strain ATCC 484 / DSM 20113 / JCM 1341 / CCUG 24087 / LMG 16345 / NBRC 15513 / NCIMB 8980 / NCTC 7547 / NRS-133) TaxID=590998 RepID=F4H1B3_CELFA|nr:polyprenyl synthetase family protein [Cellulomonas fimi]AEE45084.1 Polyprenyl synthetase [Cellulomonas fimi ATCC 484]NNH08774.1 polyprenyl synthetase family protein [Cellulomonas fimi]VEH28188.1 Heptaprenyl diphosphate synthase component 2 [Cellulomonas fimi]